MRPNVLVIASNERSAFEAILRKAGFRSLIYAGYRDALNLIELASVVICEDPLPEGSWRDVLRTVQAITSPPALIVTSRLADERLWAEVLNLGGEDVLAQPLREQEVIWAVRSAHHRCTERKQAKLCLFGQPTGDGT